MPRYCEAGMGPAMGGIATAAGALILVFGLAWMWASVSSALERMKAAMRKESLTEVVPHCLI